MTKLSFGQVFGEGAENEELEVTLNGRRVKLYKLDEVPMFFMRETPGSHPAKEPPTDPLEERVKMTPDIRLEFRVTVKAGPQTIGVAFLQKSRAAIEDLVHRPLASMRDVNTGMQYGYTSVPHLARVDITGPYNATGPGDTPSRRRIFVCRPSAPPNETPCARQIFTNLVGRAFRRPAEDADLQSLMRFYQEERSNTGRFDAGIEMGLRRILADPEFVFRFEPPPAAVPPGAPYRITDPQLASRLSFFLWSSVPDDELLALAAQGKLRDPAVLERQTRRMLEDPRSRALVTNFAGQWLYLRDLKSANPDSNEFPDFDDNLRQAFQRETEMLFESILREDRSVLDLLDADYTFVNERLARHYGIPNVYGPDFRRVPVPGDARRGLLGQGSMLLVTSNANRTSPVQRGKWILENLLGSPPPLPPPDVPPLKENSSGAAGASVRERMEEHRANPACSGCHKIMDPIGLALENFDGVGRWRTVDSGVKIDASAQLVDGTPVERGGLAAERVAEPSGGVRGNHDRKTADVRGGPRDEVLRHAGGPCRDAGRRAESLPVLPAGAGHREERPVSNASGFQISSQLPALKCADRKQAARSRSLQNESLTVGTSPRNICRAARSSAAWASPWHCRCSTRWSRRERRSRRQRQPPEAGSAASMCRTAPPWTSGLRHRRVRASSSRKA